MSEDSPLPLSDREMEILRLVTTGATNQEIASRLIISPYTVKTHLKNIFSKLGVASRTEATMVAVRQGWISVPQNGGQAGEGAVPVETPAAVAGVVPAAKDLPTLPALERWPRISRVQRAILAIALSLILVTVLLPQIVAGRSSGRGQGAIGGVFPTPTVAPASATGQWRTRAQMPTPRNGLAVAVLDGLVFAIGGVSDDGATGRVEVYDPETDAWTARRSKPIPAGFVSAAGISGKIYVPGGVGAEQEFLGILEVYDPQHDTWTSKASLPTPLAAYALSAWNDRLYLFGGLGEQGYLSSVYSYDPAADLWEARRPMKIARGLLAAATLNDRIYVVGGYDDEGEFDTCEIYDPAEDTWADCRPMSGHRGGLALVAVRNNLYAIGGGVEDYLAFNERYDPRLDIWTRVESPVLEQWRGLGAAFVDPNLYSVGGWSGENLSVNEAYQALFYQMIILP